MALKWTNDIGPYHARCKSALLNGQIPGRKAKAYHVSRFEGSASPNTSLWTRWNAEPVYGESTPVGTYLGFPSPGAPVFYEPYGHPEASECGLASELEMLKRLDKARDNGFNLAVFSAELSNTFDMFFQAATRITRAWNRFRKGDIHGARTAFGTPRSLYVKRKVNRKKVEKDAANAWLELQYGWLPLLSDVYAAAHKVASMQFPPKATVRGRAGRDISGVLEYPDGAHGTFEHNVQVETGLSFGVSDPFLAHASSLGLTNPALVVWELVPLSFCFDWLLSVGKWLEGFSRYLGLSFLDGWVSRKGYRVDTVNGPPVAEQVLYRGLETSPGVYQIVWDQTIQRTNGSVTSKSSGFIRSTMSQFPTQRPPQLNMNATWQKFVTAWGLIAQRRP